MPKQMIQLNDFSGGLNTKSSPRDIAFNNLKKVEDAIISNPGLILSSSNSSAKLATANAPNAQTTAGYGAYLFNSQYNTDSDAASVTGPNVQVFVFPENNIAGTSTKILTYARDFGNTGNFTLTEASGDAKIDMGTENGVLPVYTFVDGILYVSDENVVQASTLTNEEPKKLTYVTSDRFGVTVSGWLSDDMKIEIPGTSNFESIEEDTDGTFGGTVPTSVGQFKIIVDPNPVVNVTNQTIKQYGSPLSNIKTTPNPNDTNPSFYDIDSTDKQIYLTTVAGNVDMTNAFTDGEEFFINGEGFRVRGINVLSSSSNYVVALVVDRDIYSTGALNHLEGEVYTQNTDTIVVTGGGWESGSYEFCNTIVDLQDNETLPQAPKSTLFSIAAGSYFGFVGFKIKTATWDGRKNEKGVRIYTRKKGGNGRWILFLDVDYRKGVRTNLFEDFTSFSTDSTYHYVEGLNVINPSLDTYESINGYSQDEENIDVGTGTTASTAGGYKASAICARRHWIANVRKNGVLFDDRIYYSPVNRFSTFPDSFFLDIGISDGDSFTALHSLDNRLLAFKQKKLYIINVSSTSDAGWYLEAEFDGMGCIFQNAVTKTPYGICWANKNGVYVFDGSSPPRELSIKLDDNLWEAGQELSNVLLKPSVGYEPKYKQLYVLQDSSMTTNGSVETETKVFCYDFQTQSWTTIGSIGTADVSNFVQSFDGLYLWKHGENKIHKVANDYGTKGITIQTKDIDFESPGKIKKIYKVYVTSRDATSGSTLTLSYATDGSTSYTAASSPASGQATINNSQYEVNAYTINADCESISLQLVSSGKIDINDITIEYRQKYKRAS